MKKLFGLFLFLAVTATSAQADRYFKIQNDPDNYSGVIRLYSTRGGGMTADLIDWGGRGIVKPGYPAGFLRNGGIGIKYSRSCDIYLMPTRDRRVSEYCFCGTTDRVPPGVTPPCRGRLAVEF